jgi:hypothetical protein
MGRGGKGRERRGGMGKGLGGSTASWLLGGMDATESLGGRRLNGMLLVFVVSVEMGQQQRNKSIAQKLAQKV